MTDNLARFSTTRTPEDGQVGKPDLEDGYGLNTGQNGVPYVRRFVHRRPPP